MAILNSYNLYLVKTGNHPTMQEFLLDLAFQLLAKFASVIPRRGKYAAVNDPPERLAFADGISLHYSDKMELQTLATKKKSASKMCRVCTKTQIRERKKKETVYWCPACRVPLCLGKCFRDYHCLKKY